MLTQQWSDKRAITSFALGKAINRLTLLVTDEYKIINMYVIQGICFISALTYNY